MEHSGEQIEWLIQLSRELGRLVKDLEGMPELLQHLHPVWEAFHLLSGSRTIGFGLGPIPFQDMLDYLMWDGITEREEQLRWVKLLRSMDVEFLKFHSTK